MQPRLPGLLAILASLPVILGAVACRSASPEGEAYGEPSPYTPSPDPEPDSIGYFLTQFDKSLQTWNELKLNARNDRDFRALKALERNMARRARDRETDLIEALETGPPANREVAAVALGFTANPANLSPLLSGLSDPDEEVVQKTLLGLGVLASPDTPTAQITYILLQHPDPWTRNNAAYALARVVSAGAHPDGLADATRDALIDPEPGVRAQVASMLGLLADGDAVPTLSDMLYDKVMLVFLASASSLGRIGRNVDDQKGACARALVDALDRVDGNRRVHLFEELSILAGKSLGEETEEWRDWAYRMP